MQKKDRLALIAAFSIAAFPLVYVLGALMIALKPVLPLVLELNSSCRPEGTAEYSSDAYSQLKDILAYDSVRDGSILLC